MGKTVKQVSQGLGISKPAVTQRMNAIKNFRSNYTHKVGNHLEISEKGIDLLTNYRTKNHQSKTTSGKEDSKKNKESKQIDALYLLKQIEIKDKQIDNLQKSLDKQQTLLDQQQQLQLTMVTENGKLKERVKKLSDLIAIPESINKRQSSEKNDELSDIQKYFDIKDKDASQSFKKTEKNDSLKNKFTKSWWHFW